jgi:phytoene dehydrogenase-like protein
MYDVAIIGAGISGLVCGCYLAKAGMKVLIAEQHFKPGGYCTSFNRKGFTFDAAAHSFGGYREGGRVRNVLTDLGLDKRLQIQRTDPTDIIISPDYRLTFFADSKETLTAFQEVFPHERTALSAFFAFLDSPDPFTFARIRNWTFKRLLDDFFRDERLKTLLAFPILGNGGLPPSRLSAFIGSKIFFEFLLDGGYYPEGGMQTMADALAERFVEFGGDLMLSNSVRKIILHRDIISSIVLEKDQEILTKRVIANCDAYQVFFELIGKEHLDDLTVRRIESAIPSPSIFVLYLGLVGSPVGLPSPGVNTWVLSDYDLDRVFSTVLSCDFENLERYMMRIQPRGDCLMALINVAFGTRSFWQTNKDRFAGAFLDTIEKSFPGLKRHVVFMDAASPLTLERFTRNHQGASYGWAATPEQLGIPEFKRPKFPANLLFTGHWAMQGLGIPSAFYLGMETAAYVLRKNHGIISCKGINRP